MSTESVFYWGSGSPPCIRAMITLYEKGLGNIPQKLINFEKKEHKTPEMLSLNPRGQVPVLKLDGGIVLNESSAICDFLQMQYKSQGTKLLPDDKKLCAEVMQRKAEMETNFSQVPFKIFRFYFLTGEEQRKEKSFQDEFDKRVNELRDELKIWEGYLKKNGNGSYVVGKEFTMADVHLITSLVIFVRFGMDISKFPCLAAYYNRVKDRESVQKSWPPHWKESENKLPMLKDL